MTTPHRFLRSVVFPAAAVAALAALPSGSSRAADPAPRHEAAAPATAPADQGRSLFDGKSLEGWTVTDFGGHGDPAVEDGKLVLPIGEGLTGVTYAGKAKPPTTNYEITLQAQRVRGHDFFCGLTFPVGDSYASLIVGGWGGAVAGISSIDGSDASGNATTTRHKFETGKWYAVRLRVTDAKVEAWIDDEKVVDVERAGKKFSVRGDIDESRPLGLASWRTEAALKDIRLREIKPLKEPKPEKGKDEGNPGKKSG
jgi:hypothetical protein